jgi:hypothetical protein
MTTTYADNQIIASDKGNHVHIISVDRAPHRPEPAKHVCNLCGKPWPSTICDACGDWVRAEAIDRRKHE